MRHFIFAAVAAASLLSISAASAADVSRRAPAYMSSMSSYSQTWQGAYLGLQGGMSAGEQTSDLAFSGFSLGSASSSGSGAVFGLVGGYRWQTGKLVYGLEGDVNLGGPKSTVSLLGVDSSMTTKWGASLRPVVGVAVFEDVLLYATAGVTMAKFAMDVPGLESWSQTKMGWTVGAGADYMLTKNLFAGVQYRYEDYGSLGHDFDTIPGLSASTKAHSSTYLARVGWKF